MCLCLCARRVAFECYQGEESSKIKLSEIIICVPLIMPVVITNSESKLPRKRH